MIGREMTHTFFRAAILMIGVIPFSGCGDIGFKRGSGPDAFTAARATCRARDPAPAAVRACLSEAGWTVTALNDDAADGPVPDETTSPRDEVTAPAAPAAIPAQAAAPAAIPAQAAAPAAIPAQAAAPAATPVATTANPAGKISVAGWWKFGAGPADLDAAATACAATLGPDDQPAPGYHLVTRALRACLGAHGWHGIGGSAS